jgi:hypothetical protein
VSVSGSTTGGDGVSASGTATIDLPSFPIPPPFGLAVDSATVAHSTQAGQPVLQLALAVFGRCTAFLRVSYTAHLIINSVQIVADPGGGGTRTL